MRAVKIFPALLRVTYVLLILISVLAGRTSAQIHAETLQRQAYERARERWLSRGRIPPVGKNAADLRLRAHQQKLRKRALREPSALPFSTASATSGWQPLGPAPLASDASGSGMQDYGPVSGRVTAVVVDPADTTGNTVYVGGAYGGVWRSQNAAAGSYGIAGAVTWTPLTDNQPTLATGAIALQPGNITGAASNLILVGTGEANASRDSYYGLGFLRSTNQGNTWTLITSADSGAHPFKGVSVSKVVFSTSQPNTVVAGVGFSTPGEVEGRRSQHHAARNLLFTRRRYDLAPGHGSRWHNRYGAGLCSRHRLQRGGE